MQVFLQWMKLATVLSSKAASLEDMFQGEDPPHRPLAVRPLRPIFLEKDPGHRIPFMTATR